MKEDSNAVLHVTGMTCGACVSAVEGQVKAIEGVDEVVVSLVTEECHVKYDSEKTNVEVVRDSIMDCGFGADIVDSTVAESTRTALLSVSGMTCGACSAAITQQLSELPGVEDANVSLVTSECKVVYRPAIVTVEQLKEAIEDCGFGAEILDQNIAQQGSRFKKTTLRIFGLAYGAYTSSIEAEFVQEPGVRSVSFSLATEEASIEYDPEVLGIRAIVSRIENLGLEAIVANTIDNSTQVKLLARTREIKFWRHTCLISCFCVLLLMGIYKLVPMWFPSIRTHFLYVQTPIPGLFYRDIVGFIITTYVQFFLGWRFFTAAWNSFKHGSGSMDTFICISTSSAYSFSIFSIGLNIYRKSEKLPNVIFDASAMLIGFISIGKLLENMAKSKTNTALTKLISLAPSTCTIVEGDGIREISVDLLQVGDIIEMKPGAKIPTDGVVTEGESEVDESLITGESLLVHKLPGSSVVGGSINGPGTFKFEATKVGDDTQLANIIQTMKQAQLSKAPLQQYADYLASKFVPFILTLALLTFILWIVLSHILPHPPAIFNNSNGKFFVCLKIAISVVVVACPCALGLAAPTAIMVGTGIGARHGVLIKGGDVLEKCNSLDVFLFDKTGTLTTGQMTVENFISAEGAKQLTTEEVLCINAAESVSEHPTGKAIFEYTEKLLADVNRSVSVIKSEIVVGGGLTCVCELDGVEYKVAIGNKSIVADKKSFSHSGKTTASVQINDKLVGTFEISDFVKRDAGDAVQYLISKGYRVCMVTGDNHRAAMKVAQEVGIEANNIYSEVTPQQKNDIVLQLQDGGRKNVAFVGDGINDSPALVSSDLGFSISTGTDIAMEAADIIVLDSADSSRASLRGLIYALDIAQATFRRVKLNFFWAICYNMFMLPIAMGVLVPWGITLSPIVAGASMAASSVSVVASSLLLNRWQPPRLATNNDKSRTPGWFRRLFSKERRSEEDIELQMGLVRESQDESTEAPV